MPQRRNPHAAGSNEAQPAEGAGGVVLVERTIRLLGSFTGKEPSLVAQGAQHTRPTQQEHGTESSQDPRRGAVPRSARRQDLAPGAGRRLVGSDLPAVLRPERRGHAAAEEACSGVQQPDSLVLCARKRYTQLCLPCGRATGRSSFGETRHGLPSCQGGARQGHPGVFRRAGRAVRGDQASRVLHWHRGAVNERRQRLGARVRCELATGGRDQPLRLCKRPVGTRPCGTG